MILLLLNVQTVFGRCTKVLAPMWRSLAMLAVANSRAMRGCFAEAGLTALRSLAAGYPIRYMYLLVTQDSVVLWALIPIYAAPNAKKEPYGTRCRIRSLPDTFGIIIVQR